MTTKPYFSEREMGPRPRVKEEIDRPTWGGIIATINSSVADGSFGYAYPLQCRDGAAAVPYGCDETAFSLALQGEVGEITWPLNPREAPPTLAVLDLLEFCHRAVAKPVEFHFHGYSSHSHLGFDPEEGQVIFREKVNRIFARNGIAYELGSDGLVVRLAPEVLRDALTSSVFRTGDAELDSLLQAARTKFLDPDLNVRREALEKLWDAWERMKTIEPAKDKKASQKVLLDKAAPEPIFRAALEEEARELTNIGNTFRIRHSEITQVPLQLSEHVDYLFHRLFALVRLILQTTGRGL